MIRRRVARACVIGLVGLCGATTVPGAETIGIEVADAGREALPTAEWVEEGDRSWREGPALLEMDGEDAGGRVRGWMATTDTSLLLRVVVEDTAHVPAPDTVQLWAADGIEIGLDARGDGSGRLPPDVEGLMGPDDAKYFVALTPEGPRGSCDKAARREWRGPLPAAWVSATRDEGAGTTVYEVALPWERLGTRPGLHPTLGLSLQVNDVDSGEGERRARSWGGTAEGFRPGRFRPVALGPPPHPWIASGVLADVVWADADAGVVVFAVAGPGPHVVEARLGETEAGREVAGGRGLQRIRVGLGPGETDERSVPFEVRLIDDQGQVVATERGQLAVVEATWRALNQRIDDALATAAHPLFRRHLLSVRALATAEWARLVLYQESGHRGNAGETFGYVQTILAGFEQDAGQWGPYLRGERELYMAHVSDQDRTVQFYALSLPREWEPEKAYPLFVELHGAGNENFLSDLASRLGPREPGEDRRGPVARAGVGYRIRPSGRGNLGYRGPGEGDVWEAYDDVHRLFRIDEDRRYLYGFSMGGGGTWSLGTRTPDRWAALMIMAGGLWRESGDRGLGRNIVHVPTYVWCGEEDFLSYRYFARFVEEIERWGGQPVAKAVPGLGHQYTAEIQQESFEWLSRQVRRRPDRFSFVADTERHLGTWGIRMVRDLGQSGLPVFTCSVEGDVVRIDSEGTPGLQVVLGEDGLGLSGEVTVVWNDETAYEGPAATITLGSFREPRRRRR